jgi:hypothetical protein
VITANVGGQWLSGLGVEPATPEPEPEELPAPARDSQLLKDVSAQVVFYMSGDCHKALMRYAVEKSTLHGRVKVHDLMCEALQEWVDRKGLNVTVRARRKSGNPSAPDRAWA